MIEATRLARLAPGEWRLWIDRGAERLRIPRATLEDVIAAIIKDCEKKARDAETAARRHELAVRREQERKQREQKREQERTDKRAEHKRKEREKAFEGLISLPSEQQEIRLGELAKRLDEDVAIIRDHFTAFVGVQSWTASTDSWNVELWPDPVETQALLQKISAKIRKCIVLRPEAVIATALWTMTAWAHEGAAHSPILAAISVEPDSGKSTLLGVLRFLVPKPFVSVELSASNRPVPAYTVRLIANTRPSRETKAWLAAQPEGRFQFTFTPKHGSWLNLIEGFFSKLARTVLRHIRVASKQELKDRIMAAMDEFNRHPVVHTWSYKLDKAA